MALGLFTVITMKLFWIRAEIIVPLMAVFDTAFAKINGLLEFGALQ
jgi:hypothetical protein